MPIWAKKRFQILNRDNFECKYCWLKSWKWVQLQVDHIIPKSKGWDDSIGNLITSCFECNSWKWKNEITTVSKWIYKSKIDDKKSILKNEFQEQWNDNNLWIIDKNTFILLMRYIENEIKEWVREGIEIYSYKNNIDIGNTNKLFEAWWELCDYFLKDCHITRVYYDDTLLWLAIEEVLVNDFWNEDWECYDNNNYRLNFTLTKYLYGDIPMSFLMKFSYFFNEINNEQD